MPQPQIYLKCAYGDTLDVFEDGERLGQLAPSAGHDLIAPGSDPEWAVYVEGPTGRIVHERIATVTDIQNGIDTLIEHVHGTPEAQAI